MAVIRQLTRADVDRLAREGRHDDIVAARKDGALATLLGQPLPLDPDKQVTRVEVDAMFKAGRFEEIETARKAGLLNDIQGITTNTIKDSE
jgi:hypothetical protein